MRYRQMTDSSTDGNGGNGTPESDPANEEAVEPVEVLVQLARDGEIDPWDIDVVRVTEAFLARIDKSDLRTSGRTLFYASVLVRMKSDELLADDEDGDETTSSGGDVVLAGGTDTTQDPDMDPVDTLEAEMDRRLERKTARGNPETLDELVRELREVERNTWWKPGREYDTSNAPTGYHRGTQTLDYRSGDASREAGEPNEAAVTGTAHGEDVETIVSRVREVLDEHYDAGRDEVLFAEITTAGGSRVETYLGLLFLHHRGHVVLRQSELFGDLWIADPATGDPPSGEVVADD